ncbi:MAG: TolC family protein [Desulfobacterales bacterium]|nr:TolC family protein [Desulfobacterales bacterium]
MKDYLKRISVSRFMIVGCILILYACKVTPVKNRDDIPLKLPHMFENQKISNRNLYWADSFDSDSLNKDILILLENNFELSAARARILQAAAKYGVRKSDMTPIVNLKSKFDRSRTRDYSEKTKTTENTISLEAALSWEPDIWGKIRAREKAGVYMVEEKQALRDQTVLNLQSMLVMTWISYHGDSLLEEVLKEQLETNRQILSLIELRKAQGTGNILDILQQRGNLAAIERKLPEVLSNKKRSLNAYAVLMGFFPNERKFPKGKWPFIERIEVISSPRKLVSDRPDLKAVLLSLKAADQEVYAAVADRLPTISIGIELSRSGRTISKIGRDSTYSFIGGLLLPVFNSGRLKARASLKKAQALEQLFILEQAMLVAVREVEDALILEKSLFEELKFLEREILIAKETVDRAKLLYVNGQESFLTVFVALTKLQTLQKEEINIKQKILINRVKLLKALGAKWRKKNEKA